ncbi:MAG: T9SS type A sorting domain-containing protein [Candidatus Sabulitectum sp.]|nr:T9SS type A sorting domain-containing protein [Candidatus Sabulitectum sp.]
MTLFLQAAMILMSVQAADVTFTLDPAAVQFTAFRGEEAVYIPGGSSPFVDGEPGLPGMGYSMVIPQGTYLESVEVEVLSTAALPGIHRIAPVLSVAFSEQIPAVIPHSSSYMRGTFPTASIFDVNTGNKTGFRVASFVYVPFTWDPSTGTLSVVTSAVLTPVTAPATDAPQLRLSDYQVSTAISALQSVVRNPEMLEAYAPEIVGGVDGAPWVLIADESHETTLQPLLTLRATTHGSDFVSTQWIYANYTGYDTPEQIRNYLIDAYENQGLVYALIVGDFGETTRVSGLKIGSTGPMNTTADLYYSDLNGTWDIDNDHIYGELGDGLDYYSDIYTGRFSTDVPARLSTMVDKTVAYETNSPSGSWQTTALLAGAGLWIEDPPGYWGSFICDSIDSRIPEPWTVHKLYEDYSSHPNNQIELYNQGVSYSSLNGHGGSGGVYWYSFPPTGIVTNANYFDMNNDGMPVVFHSMACSPGYLQNVACIAERLMFWHSGGAIAVMFNSHYGWGSPPNLGASEWLELYFAEVLFVEEQYEIGVAHSISKDEFKANISVPMQTWVLQENNLLGDPALRFIAGQTGIEEGEGNPGVVSPILSAPSPNPVSGTCAVNFTMPAAATATVAVYDLSGRIAATVHDGLLSEGQGSLSFDASSLPSGCYTIVISSQTGSASTQVLVLR